MAEMTPAEELKAAAATLREAAEKAAPGPWQPDGPWWWEDTSCTTVITTDPNREAVAVMPPPYNRHPSAEQTAAWIALVHPGLAEPLAVLLDRMADVSERAHPGYTIHSVDAALAVARLINTKKDTT